MSHDYNWFDAISGKATPYDDGEHGTHVAGTVAGGTDQRAIGVAPGARIIAAKALMKNGLNTTVATLEALQWMLAPTDTQGRNPDPRRGADIVNNSWGNADQADATFIETWKGLLAAGVIPVSAAGNSGSRAGTVSPPGSYPMGISVGATNSSDKVTGFSSRGPSKFDPKAVVPLVSAPGGGVTSSVPGGGYSRMDGTSMASPHVAGAVAILLQAKPTASYEEIVAALTSSATDIDATGPDFNAGYGRINVDKAVAALLAGTAKVPAAA
jgi:bacillopeptidase F